MHPCGALQSSLGPGEGRWSEDWKTGKGLFGSAHPRAPPRPQVHTVSSPRFPLRSPPLFSRRPALILGAVPKRRPALRPRPLASSPVEPRPDRAMSAEPELIELRELAPSGRIGPGRTRLERANALRIAPCTARNPSQQHVPGRGHRFQPAGPTTHTWCDLCGDFIWGVVRKGLQCACE